MKKIILGLVALSAVSMAAQNNSELNSTSSRTMKGTFTNRIGLNYSTKGNESWDDSKSNSDNKVFDDSFGLNYKLLYNVTNRFRFGGELAYDNSDFSDYVSENTIGDDRIGTLMLGVTTEYDFYQTNNLALYISGSLGAAASETEAKDLLSSQKETLKSNLYAKLGLGARFNNGIGLEAGSRAISYKYDLSGTTNDYSDKMYRQQFYFEANYTF